MGQDELDLSAVHWQQVRHAYGRADDVPSLLRGLESGDAAERHRAIGALWSALCHQETVYSASAAAVPFLFRAARSAHLSEMQRYMVLSLVVYIGRGDDTLWEGYSSWDEVQACADAVAAVASNVVRWSATHGLAARAAGISLCVYFPHVLEAAGVDFAALTDGLAEPRLAAASALAGAIITGQALSEAAVRSAAATDAETLDYLEHSLTDLPLDRRARAVALELLDRGVASGLGHGPVQRER